MDLIIISIGALSKNPLWNERQPVRASHATTTLLRTHALDDATKPFSLLVDPSLPMEILGPRLHERAGIKPQDITDIFLTNWRPVHRRALEGFSHAKWWMNEAEIDAAREALDSAEASNRSLGGRADPLIERESSLLAKVQPAPDALARAVDLYPLPGYTPGQCGLLISESTRTTLIAGDAIPTVGHFLAGQVFPDCWDLAKAKESMLEVYEIADIIIPGHDNLFLAPRSAALNAVPAACIIILQLLKARWTLPTQIPRILQRQDDGN